MISAASSAGRRPRFTTSVFSSGPGGSSVSICESSRVVGMKWSSRRSAAVRSRPGRQMHEHHMVAAQPVAVDALQCRAGDDARAPGGGVLADPVGDRIQPGPADLVLLLAQRDSGSPASSRRSPAGAGRHPPPDPSPADRRECRPRWTFRDPETPMMTSTGCCGLVVGGHVVPCNLR